MNSNPWFSVQRYLQQRDSVTLPARRKGRREWVVARSLCHYRHFDLSSVPPARRDETLALHIRQWSPFPNYADYVVWQKGHAQVWIWEPQRVREAWAEQAIKQARVMPESVLRPPLRDGLQMLQCAEGLEVQVWQNGVLHASRWWQQAPAGREWQYFLRAHQLPADTGWGPVTESTWLAKPWGRPRRALGTMDRLRQESLWVTVGAVVFIVIAAWQGMAVWKQHQALAATRAQTDALTEQAGPILQARNQALADAETARHLLALKAYPSQLELMATVAENLPAGATGLKEWFFQSGELRFTLTAKGTIDPRFYVQTFQRLRLFQEVKSESGRQDDEIVMLMQVKRLY